MQPTTLILGGLLILLVDIVIGSLPTPRPEHQRSWFPVPGSKAFPWWARHRDNVVNKPCGYQMWTKGKRPIACVPGRHTITSVEESSCT
jgi:hypothetical protein